MFNIFKEKDNNIYSPIDGMCLDITHCSDNVFSSKMVGDGFLIKPENNIIAAPCDGKLIMVFPTYHAFGFRMNNGIEIMLHIGVNTVKLNGEGFKILIKKNSKIKKGTPLVELDFDLFRAKGYDLSVIVLMTNVENITYTKENLNKKVSACDRIIRIETNKNETNKKNK